MRSYIYTALLAFVALTLQLGATNAHGFGGSVRAGIVRDTFENRQGDRGAAASRAKAAAHNLAAAGLGLGGVGVGDNAAPSPALAGGLLSGLPLVGGLLGSLGGLPQNGKTGSLLGGILR